MSKIMNWLRYMRTTQERRRWFADEADVHLRHARAPHGLRNAWDDVWRHPQKSWKEYRRHKWRRIANI